jgi:hypothetical protein
MAAPWETPDATPVAAPPPAASGSFAPWETPPEKPGYFSSVGDAVKKVITTPYTWKTDLQTAGALVSGAAAPILAARLPHTDNETGMPIDDEPAGPGYIQRKAAVTYQPTDPNAQARVETIGAVTKPIGSALHHVASVFSDDPDTQEAISDTLGTAAGLFGGEALNAAKGLTKFGPAAAAPVGENIITHPAVVAANDLADKYGIKLTKGQQVQQAATGLAPTETTTAKALTVPYQVEAKAATQPTAVGKTYNNHFATQQNTLAAHVQDVADAVRAAGDDAAATKIEGTIVEKSPGVSAVNGKTLQRVVDKDLIDDPELAAKLDDLNDLSRLIDPPPKAPVAPPSLVGKITDKLTNIPSAVGGAVGGAAGFKVGGIFGHPILGAEAGASAGAALGSKLSSALSRGPGDISTLTTADITRLAKSAGISPEEMAQRLSQRPSAPAAGTSVSGGPLVEASPQIASPAASPSPDVLPSRSMPVVDGPFAPETVAAREMPTVEPEGISYHDHKQLMETDPSYRKAALLQAGIIEDTAPAAAAASTAGSFPPALLDNAAWKKFLTENPIKDDAGLRDRLALTEAREDAMRAQGINPRAQPGSFFSGHPNLEARINQHITDRLAASDSLNSLNTKLRMLRDPDYRKARLLQAGIIEDEPTISDLLQQSIANAKAQKAAR